MPFQTPFNQVPAPWEVGGADFHEQLRTIVSYDAVAVALCRLNQPTLDEILVADGFNHQNPDGWFNDQFHLDRLIKTATRAGAAVTSPEDRATDLDVIASSHAVIHLIPESFVNRSSWMLLLSRKDRPFSEDEISSTNLLLRHWQCLFLRPDEKNMGRLLLGHDDRLIGADLATQCRMLEQPSMLSELIGASGSLHAIVSQRYPKLESDSTRDLAIELGGQSTWVRLRTRCATESDASRQWYVELRPLEADELTPTGVVKDDRIAAAIAYLHDHFQESPSLAQVSGEVHMSPFHFHRLFTKQVGVSPKQYLQRKQLQMAKWLLRANRTPISEIAEQSGFSSHGHFTSTFHRLVGVSPSGYREKH